MGVSEPDDTDELDLDAAGSAARAGDPWPMIRAGGRLLDAGDVHGAAALYDSLDRKVAAEYDEEALGALAHMTGRINELLGNDDIAGEMFEVALLSVPGDEGYRRTVAEFFGKRGRADYAELLLADSEDVMQVEVLDTGDDHLDVVLEAANQLEAQGDLEAAAQIRRAAAKSHDDPSWLTRAAALAKLPKRSRWRRR